MWIVFSIFFLIYLIAIVPFFIPSAMFTKAISWEVTSIADVKAVNENVKAEKKLVAQVSEKEDELTVPETIVETKMPEQSQSVEKNEKKVEDVQQVEKSVNNDVLQEEAQNEVIPETSSVPEEPKNSPVVVSKDEAELSQFDQILNTVKKYYSLQYYKNLMNEYWVNQYTDKIMWVVNDMKQKSVSLIDKAKSLVNF